MLGIIRMDSGQLLGQGQLELWRHITLDCKQHNLQAVLLDKGYLISGDLIAQLLSTAFKKTNRALGTWTVYLIKLKT